MVSTVEDGRPPVLHGLSMDSRDATARRREPRLSCDHFDAASAAFKVGYESPIATVALACESLDS